MFGNLDQTMKDFLATLKEMKEIMEEVRDDFRKLIEQRERNV